MVGLIQPSTNGFALSNSMFVRPFVFRFASLDCFAFLIHFFILLLIHRKSNPCHFFTFFIVSVGVLAIHVCADLTADRALDSVCDKQTRISESNYQNIQKGQTNHLLHQTTTTATTLHYISSFSPLYTDTSTDKAEFDVSEQKKAAEHTFWVLEMIGLMIASAERSLSWIAAFSRASNDKAKAKEKAKEKAIEKEKAKGKAKTNVKEKGNEDELAHLYGDAPDAAGGIEQIDVLEPSSASDSFYASSSSNSSIALSSSFSSSVNNATEEEEEEEEEEDDDEIPDDELLSTGTNMSFLAEMKENVRFLPLWIILAISTMWIIRMNLSAQLYFRPVLPWTVMFFFFFFFCIFLCIPMLFYKPNLPSNYKFRLNFLVFLRCACCVCIAVFILLPLLLISLTLDGVFGKDIEVSKIGIPFLIYFVLLILSVGFFLLVLPFVLRHNSRLYTTALVARWKLSPETDTSLTGAVINRYYHMRSP
eukprot:MONOS_4590.1-p1 / transcript=MONOS_4590.1 / gene=MONOS_4590 / organism=Monocercomonoides_exilis_PA203 / gene_product=unspecified product / transcript_product=unspecified product / location=Mono_scaffold00123:106856-108539(+) / protein_length=477 / sequence_SO=supercontig / SO=protein_coding / is_pseudo=false